jgi:hypothetical protein
MNNFFIHLIISSNLAQFALLSPFNVIFRLKVILILFLIIYNILLLKYYLYFSLNSHITGHY